MARKDNRPSLQWYPKDWRGDTKLDKCSIVARGCWWEWLQAMWLDDKPEIVGTAVELARVAKCTPEEARIAIVELEAHEAAKIERVDKITECPRPSGEIPTTYRLTSNRFHREEKRRNYWKDWKKEKREGRCPPPVHDESTPDSSASPSPSSSSPSSSSPSAQKKKREEAPPNGGYPAQFLLLATNWNNIGAEWVHHLRSVMPTAQTNKDRKAKLDKLLKDKGWIQLALEAISTIAAGKCGWFGHNDRGWKPTFDFIMQKGVLAKILEGGYSDPNRAGETEDERFARLEAELAAAAD